MKKLLLVTAVLLSLTSFSQTDLIISEYVEGWSNNKALEIFNPTAEAINLSNYRITRYSNGSDIPPADDQWAIALPDFNLEAYKTYVIVLDKRDPEGTGQEAPVWNQLQQRADVFLCPVYNISKAMYFNGDDAVALEKADGTLVDLFARWGAPAPQDALIGGSEKIDGCWTDTPPHFTGEGVGITADHTMIKKSNIANGVVENPSVWDPLAEFDTLPANTFHHLGWHKFDGAPANETPVFSESSYAFIVGSDVANDFVVGTIKASDTENDEVKHFIEEGNGVYVNDERYEPFGLDAATGELKIADNNGISPEDKDLIALEVYAHDGFSQTSTLNVYVAVSDTPEALALLKGIEVDGKFLDDFYPYSKEYETEVSAVPTVSASAIHPDATVNITQATELPGSATIEVTAKDGSTTETYSIAFTAGVGIFEKASQETTVNVWPNPTTNNQFEINSDKTIKHLTVINIIGQEVLMIENIDNNNIQIQLKDTDKGIFMIRTEHSDNSISNVKVISK